MVRSEYIQILEINAVGVVSSQRTTFSNQSEVNIPN